MSNPDQKPSFKQRLIKAWSDFVSTLGIGLIYVCLLGVIAIDWVLSRIVGERLAVDIFGRYVDVCEKALPGPSSYQTPTKYLYVTSVLVLALAVGVVWVFVTLIA